MNKLKKYYIKGYFEHIKDKGEFYAMNLFELLNNANINYYDLDIEQLDEELNSTQTIFIGDYIIKLIEA